MINYSKFVLAQRIVVTILIFFCIFFIVIPALASKRFVDNDDASPAKKDDFDPWPWCDQRFPAVSDKVAKVGLENTSKQEQAMYVVISACR